MVKVKNNLRNLGLLAMVLYLLRQRWLRRRNWIKLKHWLNDGRVIESYLGGHEVKKLQIGTGYNPLGDWLNSDFDPPSDDIIYLDATKTLPFDDCTFDCLFSEHMIEHIAYPEGLNFLEECHRVLKPGATLRVATPNLQFLIELYRTNKTPLQKAYVEWATDEYVSSSGSFEDTFVINNFVRSWDHSFIYDEKVLRCAMEKAGFTSVVRRELNESENEELRGLENENRMPNGFLKLETLVLEATKSERD